MNLKKQLSIYILFFLNLTCSFAQKTPPTKTYHREELVKKIIKNQDFQAYYAEMQAIINLYQESITTLNEQELEKIDNCYKEEGYYYEKTIFPNNNDTSLSREELLAFAQKIKEDADRKLDSLQQTLLQMNFKELEEKKKQMRDIIKQEREDRYHKHEIFMKNYLKISPELVNQHLEKATQNLIKFFSNFAQLQSTSYETEDFDYVIKKSIKLYAEKQKKQKKQKKDICLQNQEKIIHNTLSNFIDKVHFNYLFFCERMNTLEKNGYETTHIYIFGYIQEYRKCMKGQSKK